LAGIERFENDFGNGLRRPVFLKLPEVRGLERTRIAKGHQAVHPAKRYQVEPISTYFPDVFGIL
jgi:hypothetical protein